MLFSYLYSLSSTVQVAAYLPDTLSHLHTTSTATLFLYPLFLYPLMNLYRMSLYNHSAVGCTLSLEAVPVKHTLTLVNKSRPQLLSIETLAKIATEHLLSPPQTSIHLYYLEPRGCVLPWILSSWLQTTTQMYRKWRRMKKKGGPER